MSRKNCSTAGYSGALGIEQAHEERRRRPQVFDQVARRLRQARRRRSRRRGAAPTGARPRCRHRRVDGRRSSGSVESRLVQRRPAAASVLVVGAKLGVERDYGLALVAVELREVLAASAAAQARLGRRRAPTCRSRMIPAIRHPGGATTSSKSERAWHRSQIARRAVRDLLKSTLRADGDEALGPERRPAGAGSEAAANAAESRPVEDARQA